MVLAFSFSSLFSDNYWSLKFIEEFLSQNLFFAAKEPVVQQPLLICCWKRQCFKAICQINLQKFAWPGGWEPQRWNFWVNLNLLFVWEPQKSPL